MVAQKQFRCSYGFDVQFVPIVFCSPSAMTNEGNSALCVSSTPFNVTETKQHRSGRGRFQFPAETRVSALIQPGSKCCVFIEVTLAGLYAVTSFSLHLYCTYWRVQTLRFNNGKNEFLCGFEQNSYASSMHVYIQSFIRLG